MKKVLLCFVVFIASLLFYYSYDSYNYINYARIINIENRMSDVYHRYDYVIENTDKKEEILLTIKNYAEEKNITLYLHDNPISDDGSLMYDYYFHTNNQKWIYDTLHFIKGNKIDFTDINEEGYLTNDEKDKKASGYFTSYDNNYFIKESEVFHFKTFNTITDIHNNYLNIVFASNTDAKALEKELIQKYNDVISISYLGPSLETNGGSETSILKVYRNDDIVFAFCVSFVILLLILICIISKDKREIMIRRMNGNNVFKMTMEMYFKILVFAVILFVGTFVVWWYFKIGEYNDYYIELLNDLKRFTLYAIIVVPILIFITAIYMRFTTNILELKNVRSAKKLLYMNYIVKVGMSVLLITPLMTCVHIVIPQLQKYHYISNHKEMYINQFGISNIREINEVGKKEIMKYPYCDMDDYSIYSDPKLQKDFDEEIWAKNPYMIANEAYLKDHIFYDEKGNKIDLHTLSNKTAFIPLKYKNKEKVDGLGNAKEKIYVKDTGTHYNLYPLNYQYKIRDPVILFVNEYDSSLNHNSVFLPKTETMDREYYENEFSNYSKDFILKNRKREFTTYIYKSKSEMISLLSLIVIYIFMYSLFLTQYLILYFQDNRKELSIRYMLGQSRNERYKNIFIMNIILYFIILLLGIIWRHISFITCLQFIGIIFIFDTIVILFYILYFERKNAVSILKGEY